MASGTKSGVKFTIEKGKVFDLKLGLPLVANVTYSSMSDQQRNVKAGDTIMLLFTFSGQVNEVFTLIQNGSSQLPHPTFKVVDTSFSVNANNGFPLAWE